MQTLTVDMWQDGVMGATQTGAIPDDSFLRKLWFGAIFSGAVNDYDLRNPTIGTTLGGTEIWNPTITGTLVPPFDSEAGGPGLTVSGGVVTLNNAGVDDYGIHDLGADFTDLYLHFEIRLREATLDDQPTADFFDFIDAADQLVIGAFISGGFVWDGVPDGPALGPIDPDTWYSIDVHATLNGTPPPPSAGYSFGSGHVFRAAQ